MGGGGPEMGGLISYGACNGGPGIVRNVPNPAQILAERHSLGTEKTAIGH